MASYNSFYGGRRGASFVIVKSYFDIPTMTEDFKNGNNFNDVHFDEYVIINNPNKNHPDNGKLFRRGHDYNSDRKISGYETYEKGVDITDEGISCLTNLTSRQYEGYVNIGTEAEPDYKLTPYKDNNGNIVPYPYQFVKNTQITAHGAEFIGTIIGPEGKAPHITLSGYQTALNYYENNSNEAGMDYRKKQGSYGPQTSDDPNIQQYAESLVPGKEEVENEDVFHDNIEWITVSMRDALGNDTEAIIGLRIPYLVTEMSTKKVEPYNAQGVRDDTSYIKHKTLRDDDPNTLSNTADIPYDEGHPFYNNWLLGIPEGVKGESISDIRITTFNEYLNSNSQTVPLYKLVKKERINNSITETYYESEEWNYINDIKTILNIPTQGQLTPEQDNLLYDFNHNIKIIICTTVNYDTYKDGQKKDYFLGYFTQLKSLQFNRSTGSLNDDNEEIGDGKLRFLFTGLDENNKSSKEFDFDFVNSVDLKEDGTIIFKRVSNNKQSLDQKIKWIEAIELRTNQQEIYESDEATNLAYGAGAAGFLIESQINTYLQSHPSCVYTIAKGPNNQNHYYVQTISYGAPKRLTEDELVIIESDGTETRRTVQNGKHPWNTVDANFDSAFDDPENPLQLHELGIKYNTKIDNNGTLVNEEYRTTIPFVTSLFYNNEDANLYYKTSVNDQIEIPLGQFIQIKNIKIDEKGNLYTVVNAIPDEVLPNSEQYQIIGTEKRLLNGNLNIVKDFRIVNEDDVNTEIAEITVGQQQPYSNEIQTRINEINSKLNKLEVIYTNGESEVISKNPMYFLSSFEYDQNTNQLKYQFNGTYHTADLPIVSWVGYDKETGRIEFKTGDNEGSQSIQGGSIIPFIRRIGYNNTTKDLFVQFNQNIVNTASQEGDVTVDDVISVISGENNTLENDGWIKIGNMSTYPMTPLPFTNYTYSNLYNLLIGEGYDVNDSLLIDLQKIITSSPDVANINEGNTNFTKNTVITVLNTLFSDGIIHYAFTENNQPLPNQELTNFRGYAVTVGNSDDQKDFYVFDWGRNVSSSNYEQSNTGTWYYLGTIEKGRTDIHVINSSESSTNSYGQGHLGFIYQDEVCEINQSINSQANISSDFNFRFNITRIQRSKKYTNYLDNLPINTQIAIRPKNNDGSYTENIYHLNYTSITTFPYSIEHITLGSEFANIIFTEEQPNSLKLQITAIGCDLDIEVGTNYN